MDWGMGNSNYADGRELPKNAKFFSLRPHRDQGELELALEEAVKK
jgi:hypothetical protein